MNLDLWHNIMYCVGVFVTCNVGGAALRMAAGAASERLSRHGLKKRRGHDAEDSVKASVSSIGGEAALSWTLAAMTGLLASVIGGQPGDSHASADQRNGYRPQSFEDIQRQIRPDEREETPVADAEAGKTDSAASADSADAEASDA